MPESAQTAEFRFYGELNAHLPSHLHQRTFRVKFVARATAGELLTGLGVPLDDVGLLLIDGVSVDFTRRLCGEERVAVYPAFMHLDISSLTRLAPRLLIDR